MKNIIKENCRQWYKIIVTGIILGTMFSTVGCGKEDTQFLSEIQSVEESSNLEEDTVGTDAETNVQNPATDAQSTGTNVQNLATDAQGTGTNVQNPQGTGTNVQNPTTDAQGTGTNVQNTATDTQSRETGECYVHICGAVKQPGVYTVDTDARIYEVVALAGGFREDACTEYLNQAASIIDGSQIRIPTLEEAKALEEQGIQGTGTVTDTSVYGSATSSAAAASSGMKSDSLDTLVNLNTASIEQLCTLPGIGNTKAASIIAYREQTGGFQNIEELLNVDGIKTGTFQKLKDKIRV